MSSKEEINLKNTNDFYQNYEILERLSPPPTYYTGSDKSILCSLKTGKFFKDLNSE